MNLEERKIAFIQLGKVLENFVEKKEWSDFSCGLTKEEFDSFNHIILKSKIHNGWFTEDNVRNSIAGIVSMLKEVELESWLEKYNVIDANKKVGVIMAGNIPMVGFHDMLCVLISGNILLAKPSSEDNLLLPAVANLLKTIEPRFESRIHFVPKLNEFDAVIATGSDNSARYFESYFGKYPNLIRKNRTSIAVINGNETEKELSNFALDVFLYFGKGCRNVTKVLLPSGYNLDNLFKAFYPFKEIVNHNKYANNYDYNKAVYMMNKVELIENGFLLMKEDESLHSPLAVLNYHYYKTEDELKNYLDTHDSQIQCVVGSDYIPFGKVQFPAVNDYADGEDTMKFLLSLNA
ncbi:MAG: acyl-CoA reductase [Flavobacteriales bacterium]